jgi:signal transduction histidine kinase
MIAAARAVVPGLESIALVGDPLARDDLRHRFIDDLQTYSSQLKVIDLTGFPMGLLKERTANLPDRTTILYTNIRKDGAGVNYVPREALTIFAENANRPIIVDTETYIGYGAVGGFVSDPAWIGREAANFALRILGGQSALQIPIQPADRHAVFDWRQLQRWGVSESSLPAGSEIRFREPGPWEQYRRQIVAIAGALLVQTLLIIGLLYERRLRRYAEATSRQQMSELARMNRTATAGELSASIAHEVKQPLAAITANGSAALRWLAKATPDLSEARAALERIVDNARHAGSVIDTIRSMFKKSDGERVTLNANALIEEVLALVRRDLERRRIFVETRLRSNLSQIVANQVQLQQVMLNLLVNAAEAMDSTTDHDRVLRITSDQQQPFGIVITVEDSGPGIEPENIERIFERFYTTKPGGMGMGLAICRSIIEAHEGRLSAAPGRLGGLTMQISLPASAIGTVHRGRSGPASLMHFGETSA